MAEVAWKIICIFCGYSLFLSAIGRSCFHLIIWGAAWRKLGRFLGRFSFGFLGLYFAAGPHGLAAFFILFAKYYLFGIAQLPKWTYLRVINTGIKLHTDPAGI